MTRPVRTDALETLGMIHDRIEKRDAIHLAVEPVTAARSLSPGDHVGVKDGVACSSYTPHVGIVDPFLSDGPMNGQRFWLVLYPRTIESLRHVWSHPAFPDELPAAPDGGDAERTARLAIHAVAVDLGVSDEAMMEGAARWLESDGDFDSYMFFGEDLSYKWDMPAFWDAYALLTGKDVPQKMRQAFFRCSC